MKKVLLNRIFIRIEYAPKWPHSPLASDYEGE